MKNNSDYYMQARSEMIAYLPEKFERILEIGCGSGSFLKQMPIETEKWGVELNQEKAIEAKKYLNRVIIGAIENVKKELPDHYFDVVICNDVIEHVPDHDALLELIKKKLKRSGYLVGSIPNIRYYRHLYHLIIKRDWHYADYGICDRTHLRCFTEKSLKRTLSDHQFKIEKFDGLNRANIITLHPRSWIKNLIFAFISLISCGRQNDIQFSQFAFRAYIEEDGHMLNQTLHNNNND